MYDSLAINNPVDKEVYTEAIAKVYHADEEHGTELSCFRLLTLYVRGGEIDVVLAAASRSSDLPRIVYHR